ncbi:MAG: hypothetical protein C0501_00015 [Isosphaera sp.]|nr:hypothetical protein [Isosphaera sp.]
MQIGWPGLTDSTLAVVAEARDLIELEISAVVAYAQDKGPVGVAISADGWRALAKLPNLRRLSASGVPVNEETCRAIAGLSTLRELKLGCVADDRVVIPLAGMTSLTHLEIVQRGLSAAGLMKVVVKLRELEHLDLSRSPVGDGDMKVIAGLPRLKTLVVYDTKVSDEGVLALASSPTLARVTLERREARDFEAVLNVVEKAKTSSFLHFVGEFGDDRLLHTQFP